MARLAQFNDKAKRYLRTAGHTIFEAYDSLAQDGLLEEETIGAVCLEGRPTDSESMGVVEKIISIIARGTSTEILRREADLLRAIHTCVRHEHETPSSFVNCLSGAVAQYAIQTGEFGKSMGRQLAVPMIDNARLSDDTRSSLIFKLTTESATAVADPWIYVPIEVLRAAILVITDMKNPGDDAVSTRHEFLFLIQPTKEM